MNQSVGIIYFLYFCVWCEQSDVQFLVGGRFFRFCSRILSLERLPYFLFVSVTMSGVAAWVTASLRMGDISTGVMITMSPPISSSSIFFHLCRLFPHLLVYVILVVICVVIVVRISTPHVFIVYYLITFIFNVIGPLIIVQSYVSYKGMDIISSNSWMTWTRRRHQGRVIVLIICVIICLRARVRIVGQVFVVVLIYIRKIMSIMITQANPGGVR